MYGVASVVDGGKVLIVLDFGVACLELPALQETTNWFLVFSLGVGIGHC
jgi:hypothetical protein